MRSLDEMVSAGKAKMDRKSGSMASSYNAAKGRMKTGFGATPFGPTRKSNYNTGVDAATYRTDNDKWARNWRAKMAE
jgi:hypothetical protein